MEEEEGWNCIQSKLLSLRKNHIYKPLVIRYKPVLHIAYGFGDHWRCTFLHRLVAGFLRQIFFANKASAVD